MSSSENCESCVSIKHDRYECGKDCSGCEKCKCVVADCSSRKKTHRKTKTFKCDLPCSPRKAIKILKVKKSNKDHTACCEAWIAESVTYDPLKAWSQCAKPPCLANLPACCDVECCKAKTCKRCYKSSSSSSSSSEECIRVKIPKRKVCPGCGCSSSSSSSSSSSCCGHKKSSSSS